MISIKEKAKFVQMIAPGKGAGTGGAMSTSASNLGSFGNVVDTLGFREAIFRLSATSKAAVGKKITISIREGDTTSASTAITDGVGDGDGSAATATFTELNLASGTTTQGLLRLVLDNNRKRYLKAYIVRAGTTGGLTMVALDCVLGDPIVAQPVTQPTFTAST